MIVDTTFKPRLRWGQVGETAIACWLLSLGWTILPVYEKVIDTGKGPRLRTAYRSGYGDLIAPDMLAMKENYIKWVEGKRKSHFSWRYTRNVWQDGIDLHHYLHYIQIREHKKFPLWLLFLHESGKPSDNDLAHGCPAECPTGLYGGEINYLKTVVAHNDGHEKHGRSFPMVYWDINHLKLLATLDEVFAAQEVSA